MKFPIALALSSLVLAGCASAPLSYINDNQVYYPATLNRFPLFVTLVDGQSPGFRPVPITPGTHAVTMAAVPVAGFSVPVDKTYPMTIEPCTRYYVAAQRTSPVVQDWELVIERTFPVGGCDPAKELEKAKSMAVSSR